VESGMMEERREEDELAAVHNKLRWESELSE
jgi:hypothetical protein